MTAQTDRGKSGSMTEDTFRFFAGAGLIVVWVINAAAGLGVLAILIYLAVSDPVPLTVVLAVFSPVLATFAGGLTYFIVMPLMMLINPPFRRLMSE